MINKISPLRVRESKFMSNKHIDLNHWSTLLATKKTVFEAPTRALFASKAGAYGRNFSGGSFLEHMYGAPGKVEEIDTMNWSWKMKVGGLRPMTIIENRTSPTVPGKPGKYREDIVVVMDFNLGVVGEQWGPGSSDKSQVLNITNITKEARGFVYTMQTYTDTSEMFLKPSYLKPGTRWTRLHALRGEASESGGAIEAYTDVEFSNKMIKARKQYSVTDFGAQAILEIDLQDATGKKITTWMTEQEALVRMSLNKELAYSALYGRLSDTPMMDPDSGYPIVPGAGAEQQISFGGNIEHYTTMSAELVEAFIERVVYSRIAPGDLGEVVGYSGYYGMKMFSAALDTLVKKSVVRQGPEFTPPDKKGVNKNSMQAGYQFTVYNLPNGGTFRLIYNPYNDDEEFHRDVDPLTGYPLQSQRITILDITGGNESGSNIKLYRKKNSMGMTTVLGATDIYGENVQFASTHKQASSVTIVDTLGIQVTDATKTGELIRAVSANA